MCADSDDCTDGTCNSNKICECDKDNDYKLVSAFLRIPCEMKIRQNYVLNFL